jgi:hypothetical protein
MNMLPGYAIGGAGTVYSNGLHPIGEPQLYYGQALTLDGLPGVAYQGIGSTGVMDWNAYIANLQSVAGEV